MADEKPKLRVVAPDEVAPPPPAGKSPSAPPQPEAGPLVKKIEKVDSKRPLLAGYLVCVGCRLADAAVDFYHQAAQHAPAGTFRNDVPPGLRSAEATRAWLGSHLDELKKLAEDDAPKSPYERGPDLCTAVALAASELDRAMGPAKEAGLWFDERRTSLFHDADEDLDAGLSYAETVNSKRSDLILDDSEEEPDLYIMGLDMLGNFFHQQT